MTHVLHRHLRRTPPVAVAGRGMFITDASGKEYLDACGGAAVSCLGHGHPDVLAAMHAQTDRLAYAHTSFFTTEVAEELADRLIADGAGRDEPRVLRQRRLRGDRGRAQDGAAVFRRDRAAAARDVHRAAAELSRQYAGRARRRRQRVAAPAVRAAPDRRRSTSRRAYAYREQRDDETAEAYGARLAAELDATIERLGPDKVIAFVAETVGGATAGVLTPVPGYFKAVREVCDRHGVPADPGRGDVRDGPHRHAARLRAGRRRARSPGDRQGAGRRLPADRRGAGPGTDRRRDGAGQRLLPARPHLPRPSGRLRGGARRAERDRARRAARARPRARVRN